MLHAALGLIIKNPDGTTPPDAMEGVVWDQVGTIAIAALGPVGIIMAFILGLILAIWIVYLIVFKQ